MRIRTIKPEFWTNERLAELSEFTRLLAIGLLNYSDDEGYFNANLSMIRGALFPFLESSKMLPGAIQQLEKLDYIRIRESQDGRRYGWVVCFTKHQRVDKPKSSNISDLCDFQDESKINQGSIQDESTLEGNREQGTGNGREQGKEWTGLWNPSERQTRVNTFFNRRNTTLWSDHERKAWKKNAEITPNDEFEILEKYYLATNVGDIDYRRRDLVTLLNNWQGEIDRARKFTPPVNGTTKQPIRDRQ